MLKRVEWTRGPGNIPAVQVLDWFTDGSTTVGEKGVEIYGQSVERNLSISPGKHATVFQAEV